MGRVSVWLVTIGHHPDGQHRCPVVCLCRIRCRSRAGSKIVGRLVRTGGRYCSDAAQYARDPRGKAYTKGFGYCQAIGIDAADRGGADFEFGCFYGSNDTDQWSWLVAGDDSGLICLRWME